MIRRPRKQLKDAKIDLHPRVAVGFGYARTRRSTSLAGSSYAWIRLAADAPRIASLFSRLTLVFLAFTSPVFAQPDVPKDDQSARAKLYGEVGKDLAAGAPIEIRALEIRARIYEPQVIYVLDRAKLDVDLLENTPKFSPRIADPILENRF